MGLKGEQVKYKNAHKMGPLRLCLAKVCSHGKILHACRQQQQARNDTVTIICLVYEFTRQNTSNKLMIMFLILATTQSLGCPSTCPVVSLKQSGGQISRQFDFHQSMKLRDPGQPKLFHHVQYFSF